jgi:hypothetical protein
MIKSKILKDVIAEASNRRSFVRKLGFAGLSMGAALRVQGQDGAMAAVSDADILNFALNLEYLEAEFYTVATTGKYIESHGICVQGSEGMLGPTTGGKYVDLTVDPVNFSIELIHQVAHDERQHVRLIQSALQSAGAPFISKPSINLNALGFGFDNYRDFFKLARIFEDIGVSAYSGAAPLITDKAVLGAAARILAAECEHAGAIRLQVARLVQETAPRLDGADILPPPSGKNVLSLDKNGLSAIRTPGQVLYLAYAGTGKTSGGFFPQGVNGTLNTSSDPATKDNR